MSCLFDLIRFLYFYYRVYIWCACDWSHIVNNGIVIVINKSNSGDSNNNNNLSSQRWKEAKILANAKQIKTLFVWMCVWLRVWLVCVRARNKTKEEISEREINSAEEKRIHCIWCAFIDPEQVKQSERENNRDTHTQTIPKKWILMKMQVKGHRQHNSPMAEVATMEAVEVAAAAVVRPISNNFCYTNSAEWAPPTTMS